MKKEVEAEGNKKGKAALNRNLFNKQERVRES
jgi:hypothetical protein